MSEFFLAILIIGGFIITNDHIEERFDQLESKLTAPKPTDQTSKEI